MKLISWNVNGLRAVYKSGFIDWLTQSQADIVALQETKAELSQLPWDLQFIKGYDLTLNSAVKKGYSGTGIFSKLPYTNVTKGLGFNRADAEGRVIQIEFDQFILLNLYIPNGARDKKDMAYKLRFYDHFIQYLDGIKAKNVILMGDFNIAHKPLDLARPKQNENNTMYTPEERQKLDAIVALGFVDTFRLFTKEGGNYSWLSYYKNFREHNIGWRIDYVFVSESLKAKVTNAFILKNVPGSDHVPVGIDLEL